ncbi:ABC transporter ATP-binding protein [Lysinibacillus sp. 54212]|uniref:ABC transporter ATP-binding protein n=1 Tax=Lysinibacillus sp. 54212 TaxID=3119829 RepID=UPI002FC76F4A
MLEGKNIYKGYGKKKVVQDISLNVQPGEVVGLVGENGAGKSTLLNTLATITKPASGSILLNGLSYEKDVSDCRRMIGYVPQELSVWDHLSVKDNMRFFEKLSWKSRGIEECRQLCLDMSLEQWEEPAASLSGGMKRKLNLAISLIHDPQLILLDEPTVGIDLKSKTEIGQYLVQLAKKENKMIVYTSHDMDEIISCCDRVYIIGSDPFYYELLSRKNVPLEWLGEK